jgi:hypothetical protein
MTSRGRGSYPGGETDDKALASIPDSPPSVEHAKCNRWQRSSPYAISKTLWEFLPDESKKNSGERVKLFPPSSLARGGFYPPQGFLGGWACPKMVPTTVPISGITFRADPPLIGAPPGVAIVGNIVFSPSRGTSGFHRAPLPSVRRGKMLNRGKSLPDHLGGQPLIFRMYVVF